MQEPVLTTYKILKEKAFNANIDEGWVDWVHKNFLKQAKAFIESKFLLAAIEMMEAGYEADSLYQLAGTLKPYNQFELQVLTSQVLKDLQLDYSDKRKALKNYVYF